MSELQGATVADDAEGVVEPQAPPAPADELVRIEYGPIAIDIPASAADTDKKRQNVVRTFLESDRFKSFIDGESGSPATVRAIVGSAAPQDRLANIQRYYPDAIPYGDNNFIYTEPETGKITLYNPEGLDFGDVASVAKEATVAVASGLGAAGGGLIGLVGGPAAPVTVPGGAATGAGIGAAVGAELFDISAGLIGGRVDTRSVIDRALQPVTEFFLAASGQRAGELVGEGVKRALGGGTQRAAQLASKFRSLRIEPSAATVSSSNTIALLEKTTESNPFSASILQEQAERILQQIKLASDDVVNQIGTPRTKQGVGQLVREAAERAGDRFDGTAAIQYDKVMDLIGKDAPVAIDNVKALRLELESRLANAPKALNESLGKAVGYLRQVELNSTGEEILNTVRFEDLRALRTALGKNLDNPILAGSTSAENVVFKQVYSAMSLDLAAAAKYAGPQAEKAMARADRYYKKFMSTAGVTLNKIGKLDSDERAYTFAMSRIGDGGSQLRRMRQQFEPEEWDVIAASFLNNMGLARAGAQDAAGEVFSVNEFVTNWSKISNEAKDALFGGKRYADMRKGLDNLVEISSSLKGVEKFANTSNSGRIMITYMSLQALGGGLISMAAGGEAETGVVLGALSAVLAPRLAAKLITSPKFINWLTTPITNPNAISAHMGRLSAIAAEDPLLREPIQEFVRVLRSPSQLQGDEN